MQPIEISKEMTEALWREDWEGWETVEEGDWTQDHKYQHCEIVVIQKNTGQHYMFDISRSGSPFTDWYYSFEDTGATLYPVEKIVKKVVVESWERM